MSASVYWHPTAKGKSLGVSSPSRFVSAMRSVFGGEGPWVLGDDAVSQLRAMAAVSGEGAYTDLVEAIEASGEVMVTVEY